jgi:hypothetical protein
MTILDYKVVKRLVVATALAASSAVAGMIGYTGSETSYTIPTTGSYFILAAGAAGGSGTSNPGGSGTEIEGSAVLNAGTVLDIVVGGMGSTGNFGSTWGGGGGGGTFVWVDGSSTPLLIAVGGGGASYDAAGGVAATEYTTVGGDGFGPGGGAGGTAGAGGAGGTGDGGEYNGGGGAGWATAGGNGQGNPISSGTGSAGDGGFDLPTFAGGLGGCDTGACVSGPFADGGFGGGGGGGWQGGGGGGGYSGGGGGDGVGYAGGAGGSYLDDSLEGAGFLSGGNIDDGFIDISFGSTPEPGTIALFCLGLAGIGFVRRRTGA